MSKMYVNAKTNLTKNDKCYIEYVAFENSEHRISVTANESTEHRCNSDGEIDEKMVELWVAIDDEEYRPITTEDYEMISNSNVYEIGFIDIDRERDVTMTDVTVEIYSNEFKFTQCLHEVDTINYDI